MPQMPFKSAPKVHARTASANLSAPATSVTLPANIILLVLVGLLLACGLVTLYAVTLTETEYSIIRQLVGVGIGIAVMVAFWFFDYRRFADLTVPLLVLDAILILLPMVPGLGMEVNGATSWIRLGPLSFQPSELAKPVTILAVASATARYQGAITKGTDFLKLVGIILIPFVLLVREDLGTGLVILIVGFCILIVGGAAKRWLIASLMIAAILVAALLGFNGVISDWTGGSVQLIKPYQMSRLLVFIDQDNPDYADDAYNLNQAKIAVGSGEFIGKGWGKATQSSGGFLPESATDFIFCVFAEQFGFLGAFVLLGLYLALLAVALGIGLNSSNLFGSLIAAGIMGMWLFQIVENIGMDLGLMPITGIPLPFMSYGSSFMITNFICVGLLLSIWSHRGGASTRSGKVG